MLHGKAMCIACQRPAAALASSAAKEASLSKSCSQLPPFSPSLSTSLVDFCPASSSQVRSEAVGARVGAREEVQEAKGTMVVVGGRRRGDRAGRLDPGPKRLPLRLRALRGAWETDLSVRNLGPLGGIVIQPKLRSGTPHYPLSAAAKFLPYNGSA